MNKVLLDTDTYSEVIKGIDPIVTRNATLYRQHRGILTISAITVMEIVRGFQKNQSHRKLRDFLLAISLEEILIFDHAASELAGIIAGDLERAGRSIGVADPMIAAIAISQRLELATGNTSHFQRIQQLGYPLMLTNWRF